MSLSGKNVLITGASMGIGAAMAKRLAKESANLILIARSPDKLASLKEEIKSAGRASQVVSTSSVDVRDHSEVEQMVKKAVDHLGPIDIVINNAGLALGTPNAFPELKLEDINTMIGTNIHGMMYVTYSVLNAGGMRQRGSGTILNVTSTTALEPPPFPGEACYHTSKAAQEAFTNSLRNELVNTNIKVLAIRPGVVATNFHEQRVGYDSEAYEEFMKGYRPLVAEEVADAAVFMLTQKENVSIKALDIVPTPQRSLSVFDRTWNERNA